MMLTMVLSAAYIYCVRWMAMRGPGRLLSATSHVWAAAKVSAQTSVSPPQYHAGVHIFIDTIQHVIKAPGGIG